MSATVTQLHPAEPAWDCQVCQDRLVVRVVGAPGCDVVDAAPWPCPHCTRADWLDPLTDCEMDGDPTDDH